MGRPQKQVTKLLSNKEIKQEANGGKQKIRGECTNWFQPNLWPPILDVIKKYGNNSQALHFLKTTHKKHGIPSPYEKLQKASLWDWLTPNRDFKPIYIHVTKLGTIMK